MDFVVVGSGPSGLNAALTLLQMGHQVEVWDVGRTEPDFPAPEASFTELVSRLADPQAFFFGSGYQALIPPGRGEVFDYPPSRTFMIRRDDPLWPYGEDGFRPIASFDLGGLGVGWGANVSTFDDNDLAGFPISAADLAAGYQEACRRVGVAGPAGDDDLTPFLPGLEATRPPLRLTDHDRAVLAAYESRRGRLNRLGVRLGLARMAVETGADEKARCSYCGRCLWGCPRGSIYNPADKTLAACRRYPGFKYLPDRLVIDFETRQGRVTAGRFIDLATGKRESAPCRAVLLAAGALQSGAIYLRTIKNSREKTLGWAMWMTKSVMDTRVVKIPYLRPGLIGRPLNEDHFQFNRLIMAVIDSNNRPWPSYVHGEILSLTSLLHHPLMESLRLGSRLARRVFPVLASGLGVVTLFFADRPEKGNGLVLEDDPHSPTGDRVVIRYRETEAKRLMIARTVRKTIRALRAMGCLVPPAGIKYLPPGAGIHYAGTIPMGSPGDPLGCDAQGRSGALGNMYIADGAAFPELPSKSITLSLIANAIRTARQAGRAEGN